MKNIWKKKVTKTKVLFDDMHGFKWFQNENASQWVGMFCVFHTKIKPPRRSIYY